MKPARRFDRGHAGVQPLFSGIYERKSIRKLPALSRPGRRA